MVERICGRDRFWAWSEKKWRMVDDDNDDDDDDDELICVEWIEWKEDLVDEMILRVYSIERLIWHMEKNSLWF